MPDVHINLVWIVGVSWTMEMSGSLMNLVTDFKMGGPEEVRRKDLYPV